MITTPPAYPAVKTNFVFTNNVTDKETEDSINNQIKKICEQIDQNGNHPAVIPAFQDLFNRGTFYKSWKDVPNTCLVTFHPLEK